MASAKPALLINSTLGKMGTAVAEAAVAAGVQVLPYTLCAEGQAAERGGSVLVAGQQMQLVEPGGRDAIMQQLKAQHPNLIVIDYTVPDVIHDMVNLYIKHHTPFVMGTTGGDRQKIVADVQAADLYAVIAPQMGKQVGRGWPLASRGQGVGSAASMGVRRGGRVRCWQGSSRRGVRAAWCPRRPGRRSAAAAWALDQRASRAASRPCWRAANEATASVACRWWRSKRLWR
jgi:hypothetical protein